MSLPLSYHCLHTFRLTFKPHLHLYFSTWPVISHQFLKVLISICHLPLHAGGAAVYQLLGTVLVLILLEVREVVCHSDITLLAQLQCSLVGEKNQ